MTMDTYTLTDVLTAIPMVFLVLYVLGTAGHWGAHPEHTLLDILHSWRWLLSHNVVRR